MSSQLRVTTDEAHNAEQKMSENVFEYLEATTRKKTKISLHLLKL